MTAIIATDLHKAYAGPAGITPVLRGVDLRIDDGTLAAITGPSGCGKSTLLHALGGIDPVDAGSLEVVGVRLDGATVPERRRFMRDKVGFVFQRFNLLSTLTAAENVEVGLEPLPMGRAERRDRARAVLDQVGLGAKHDRFPDQLSVGEQQRVAIARAVAKRPALLLADEPTGALDRANSDAVMALLDALRAETGMTQIVVTHDPRVARAATVRFALADGRIESA